MIHSRRDSLHLRLITILGCMAFLVASGCSYARRINHPGEVNSAWRSTQVQRITEVLNSQAEVWNRGDVEGFMDGYWRSPALTFSSRGQVTRGFEPTLEHFRKSYPDRAAMGTLTFSDLEITPLCPHVALILGRWKLEGEKPASGAFSLTMQRIEGRWLIVHDHTSRDAT